MAVRTYTYNSAVLRRLFAEPSGQINSEIIGDLLDSYSQELITGGKEGTPTNSQILLRWTAPAETIFPAALAGSAAVAGTAATAETIFELKKNGGTAFGTVTFAISGTVGTMAAAAAETFDAGDQLTLVSPASADATLADLGFTFVANK